MSMIYKYTESKTRVRTLTASVLSGTPLLDPEDSRPAVAITNSGDITKTVTSADIPMGGGVTSITYANGGVGLIGKETTLAYDGTWEFEDVVSSGSTAAPTSTPGGTQVYITAGGELTLTESTNTEYGIVDYPTDYTRRAGILPVRIGD